MGNQNFEAIELGLKDRIVVALNLFLGIKFLKEEISKLKNSIPIAIIAE